MDGSGRGRRRITQLLVVGAVTLGVSASTGAALPAAGVHAPACRTPQLAVWWGMPASGAAGSSYYVLQLSNVSAAACTLTGFPGVSAVDAQGRQLGSAATWERAYPPSRVTLAPAATAHAVLRVTDVGVFAPAACRPVTAAGLRVYPPNTRTATVLPLPVGACSATGPTFLTVRAVRPHAGIPGHSA